MFSQRFKELDAVVANCTYTSRQKALSETEALNQAIQLIQNAASNNGIVYVIGNGGSAGIASHFSNDLMKALKIPSQTLYDSNLLTCLANDLGYENIFSYPLHKLLRANDLLVAISSSGKSPNILNGVEAARQKGTPVITLSGFLPNNPLSQMGELNFWIDRSDYGLVETAHFFLLHTIIDLWNQNTLQVLRHAQVRPSAAAK